MFDNIGEKIKGLAKFYCWVGIIASCIGGIAIMLSSTDPLTGFIVGILSAALGSLLSWVSSFLLYGFGELIDSTESIYYLLYKNNKKDAASTWKCSKCGTDNSPSASYCDTCGKLR